MVESTSAPPSLFNRLFFNRHRRIRAVRLILLYAALTVAFYVIALSAYDRAADMFFPGEDAILGSYLLLLIGAIFPGIIMLGVVHKQPAKTLGFGFHNRVWIEIVQGVVQGSGMVALIFFLEWTAGWANINWAGIQSGSAGSFAVHYLFYFVIAGAFEEALLRGYAFQVLIQGIGKTGAVVLTSCAFGLTHLANPNVSFLAIINTIVAGTWLSIAYLKTRSLWLPCTLHISWNTVEGLIFGFPVSGMPFPSVFKLTQHGNAWITGGGYGPEGGVLSLAVLVIGTIFIMKSKWIYPSPKATSIWE